MGEEATSRGRGKQAAEAPEWTKFRLEAETREGLDTIAAWLESAGLRPPRRGRSGASRADALRYAVEQTVQAINGTGNNAAKPPAASKRPGRSKKS